MKRYTSSILISIVGLFLFFVLGHTHGFAQEEAMQFHELEPEDDAFQEAFFRALRYKAIGNYKLALQSLDEAENESDKIPEKSEVINFERAQNHYYLHEYEEAVESLERLSNTNKKREVLAWLYQINMQARDYKNAKKNIVELLSYSEVYLPSFYMLYMELLPEPEEALRILEEIFENKKGTRQVGFYKNLIQEAIIEKPTEIVSNAEKNILQKYREALKNKNQEEVLNYIKLLLQYEDKIDLIWKELIRSYDEKQAYEILEKIYTSETVSHSGRSVLLSNLLEQPIKSLNFQVFLEKIHTNVDEKSLIKIGDYLQKEDERVLAKHMYLQRLAISFDNYSLIIETLQLLSTMQEYSEQLELVEKAMEYYPMQPTLYLYKGKAMLGMKQWSEAQEILEEGEGYIIDHPELESEFVKLIKKAKQQ